MIFFHARGASMDEKKIRDRLLKEKKKLILKDKIYYLIYENRKSSS
jgi:hypothetical protein